MASARPGAGHWGEAIDKVLAAGDRSSRTWPAVKSTLDGLRGEWEECRASTRCAVAGCRRCDDASGNDCGGESTRSVGASFLPIPS